MEYVIIGAGSRGMTYGHWAKEHGIKIAAIAEIRPERLKSAAKELNVPETMQFSNDKNLLVSLAEDFVGDKKIYLDKLASKIANKAESFASENDYALKLKLAHLNKLNPLDILSLGYAKIEQNQKSVSCKKQLDENAEFEIYFADGQVIAKGVGK